MEETYVYTVVPKRPIRGVVKGKIITKESNLFLTKDEVLLCLKHGPVYRKFYHPDKPEKVTPSNLDRLHRAEHLTEEQYNALLKKGSTDDTEVEPEEVEEEIVEESPVEEVAEVEEEQPAEEVEVIEDTVDSEELNDEEVKKVEEEQSSTESDEQTVEEDVVLPKKTSSSKKKKKKTRTATSVTAVPETPQDEEQ